MIRAIALVYALALSAVTVATLLTPDLFGLDDGSRGLLAVAEFIGGVFLLTVLMAVLPRRFQQSIAGAQPTSAMMRRRMDRVLVALRVIAARSAQADVAALGEGATLYARAVRTDGARPLLGVLLLEAPAGGRAVVRWRQRGQVEEIPAPYTLSERENTPMTAVARQLKATSTVRIGAFATVQVTPMDLEVLTHVAAASRAAEGSTAG
jgi:hypothetical protein